MTALIGGVAFGVTLAICEGRRGPMIDALLTVTSLFTLFLAVGTFELREHRVEAQRRNCGPLPYLMGPGDFQRFHRPIIIRSLLFVSAAFLSVVLHRALFG